jgi:hypothetical protein
MAAISSSQALGQFAGRWFPARVFSGPRTLFPAEMLTVAPHLESSPRCRAPSGSKFFAVAQKRFRRSGAFSGNAVTKRLSQELRGGKIPEFAVDERKAVELRLHACGGKTPASRHTDWQYADSIFYEIKGFGISNRRDE